MSDIVERLQFALNHADLSWSKAAVNIGLSAQASSKWKKGQIGRETLNKLAKETNVNIGWLVDGHGSPFDVYQENKLMSELKGIEIWNDNDPVPNGMVAISYLQNIYGCLGDGYINEDYYDESKLWFKEKTLSDCNVNPEYARVINVQGDSMFPEIVDGQVIAIDTSATRIFDGEIYAFTVNGELKIKYLFKHGDGFKAVSRNEDKLRYPDEIYTLADIEVNNVRILGQFWWKSETRRVRR